MTDNAELVATAKAMREQLGDDYPKPGSILALWFETANALEAVIQERDNWKLSAEEAERAEKRWKDRAHDYSTERDQYAAVVEKVREEATVAQRDADLGQWADDLLAIITTAPADLLREHVARVRADAIREYVEAARENPHTQYWPASGVLDDAEQWADEIEKGTI